MKVGDVVEVAIWLTGEEPPELRARFEADADAALRRTEAEQGVVIGPVAWTVKRPGEDRVPPVPDHVQGLDVHLLVGEAEVVAEARNGVGLPLSRDLEEEHLMRLRAVVRAAHQLAYPVHRALTDAECDAVIDEHGPEAAAQVVFGSVH